MLQVWLLALSPLCVESVCSPCVCAGSPGTHNNNSSSNHRYNPAFTQRWMDREIVHINTEKVFVEQWPFWHQKVLISNVHIFRNAEEERLDKKKKTFGFSREFIFKINRRIHWEHELISVVFCVLLWTRVWDTANIGIALRPPSTGDLFIILTCLQFEPNNITWSTFWPNLCGYCDRSMQLLCFFDKMPAWLCFVLFVFLPYNYKIMIIWKPLFFVVLIVRSLHCGLKQ